MISVIMPCYNAAATIGEAIASVFAQSEPDFELIVVDDGSTDATPELVADLRRRHGDRLTLLNQDHRGPFPARNLALGAARGDFVTFLDADDWWDGQFLAKMRRTLDESGADLAYCGWHIRGTTTLKPYIPPPLTPDELLLELLSGCPWCVHSVLLRQPLVAAVGGFCTRYFSAMDVDFWLRVSLVTQNLARVPEVLAYYRYHDGGQISSVRWRQALNAHRVRRDFLREHPDLRERFGGSERLKGLVNATLRKTAFEAYWQRDLASSRPLFRELLRLGAWSPRDLKYLLPSLAPEPVYRRVLERLDHRA